MTIKSKIALLGYGYWGKKLYSTLVKILGEKNVYVYDPQIDPAQTTLNLTSPDELSGKVFTHVFIATPEETHFILTKKFLELGKHVFVEKPLCLHTQEASQLQQIAEAKKLNLYVDYTFIFDPAILKIIQLSKKNKTEIIRAESIRHSINIHKPKVDVFADLATHDIYLFRKLFNKEIKEVRVTKEKINSVQVNQGRVILKNKDLEFVCDYSWAQPTAQRKLTIFFSNGEIIVWDKSFSKLQLFENQKLKKQFSIIEKRSPLELSIIHFLEQKGSERYVEDVSVLEKIRLD